MLKVCVSKLSDWVSSLPRLFLTHSVSMFKDKTYKYLLNLRYVNFIIYLEIAVLQACDRKLSDWKGSLLQMYLTGANI